MTDRPLAEKKESRCVHLVGGRQCRIPANWFGGWPLDANKYPYCTRHKNARSKLHGLLQWEKIT